MNKNTYIGRFAPSPSGPLHFGSLIAALASYLQAKSNNGKWLLRIEDVDTPRTVPGADKVILKQLENLGLYWDGEIVYQSQNTERYQSVFNVLQNINMIFPCSCSRKELDNSTYPGTCRKGTNKKLTHYSQRLIVEDKEIGFHDLLQGYYSQSLKKDVGDFVLKRRDDIFTYHLAVVIDDADQNISEIVRGVDLLDSTPRHIYLQNLLQLNTPDYLHLPIAVNNQGNKLSKQTNAQSIDINSPLKTIYDALKFLGQSPPNDLSDKESLLNWSIQNWQPEKLPRKEKIVVIDY